MSRRVSKSAALWPAWLFTCLAGIPVLTLAATAQECPTAETAKAGFSLQRAGTSIEVRPASDLFVHVVNTYPNGKKQDVLYFRGLLVATRSDASTQSISFPLSDWRSIFPLDVGARRTLNYVPLEPAKAGRLTLLELSVTGRDKLQLGPCSYDVLVIRNRFLGPDGKLQSEHADFYSPELGYVLAKRYDERGGRQTTMKYESIKPLGRASPQ
jgi:hypothetical protein